MGKPIRDMTIVEYVNELKNDKNKSEKTEAFKHLKGNVKNGVNDPAEQHEELSNIKEFPLKYFNVSVYLLIDYIFQDKSDEFNNLLGKDEGINSRLGKNNPPSPPDNDSNVFVGRKYSKLKTDIFSENKINKDSTVFQFCTELYKLI